MKIILAPDDRLKRVCTPFVDADFPYNRGVFAEMLHRTRIMGKGLGLAAPQVGYTVRVFAMSGFGGPMTCFNPRVVSQSGGKEFINEGCLSFPGQFLRIGRSRTIEVEYEDADGALVQRTLHGLDARAFLHELDHLDGKTFDTIQPLALALRMKAKRAGRR